MGCQFICMNYQLPDDFMDDYITRFRESSFIERPAKFSAQSYGSAFRIGPFKMAKRHSFIISPTGKIVVIYRKVNPSNHSNEIIDKLKLLTSSN